MNPENTREKKIEQMFAQNPDLETVFVTSDDFGFSKESSADSHAQALTNKEVEAFKREQFFPVENTDVDILALSVPKLVKAIADVNDIEQLNALKDAEEAKGETARKSAVEAIQVRIDALVAEIEVNN